MRFRVRQRFFGSTSIKFFPKKGADEENLSIPHPMANNKKVIALVGCGCFAVVAGVLILAGLAVTGAFGLIKGSEPYQESFRRVSAHPEAIAALGAPVKAGFVVMGSVELKNDGGTADFSYAVSGPNGGGNVFVTGAKSAGAWNYSRMELKISNQSVDLLSSP